MTDKILEIANVADYDDNIESENSKDVFYIIDFWASWCRPCINFTPAFTEVANEKSIANKIVFCKINIDSENNQEIATKFQIMSIPTIVIIKNKEVVARTGSSSKEDFIKWIEENIN
ncbi:MAG: thioredoxin domain-containing protein [Anaplasmataceae bacterium]|nr:thioredoxin domain-containing protein [Anaplasmataceae bacterium]